MCPGPHQNKGQGWHCETGLSPPVKYFTDHSKEVLLLWIMCCLCLMFVTLSLSVHYCLVVTCWEWADLLALVCEV